MAEFYMPKFVMKDKPIALDDCYRELSKMSYQSPINVISQGIRTQMENDIFKAIQSYDVAVNKDELTKALKYDRDQYEKGFIDGCRCNADAIKAMVAREIFEEILNIIRAYEFDALTAKNDYGVFQVRNFGAEILKLKKKYTEEKE